MMYLCDLCNVFLPVFSFVTRYHLYNLIISDHNCSYFVYIQALHQHGLSLPCLGGGSRILELGEGEGVERQ